MSSICGAPSHLYFGGRRRVAVWRTVRLPRPRLEDREHVHPKPIEGAKEQAVYSGRELVAAISIRAKGIGKTNRSHRHSRSFLLTRT